MKKNITILILFIIVVLGIIYFSTKSSNPSAPLDPLPTPSTQTVSLYYYSESLDQDETGNIMCSEKGMVAVERMIPDSKTTIDDTIRLLIKGELTSNETNQGISTEYPLPGFEFVQSDLENGILTLTFNDPQFKTSGGACRVQILQHQIERTAKQFNEVSEVIIKPSDIFQP